MITQQSQIKVSLSASLKDYLASKAGKFDMPIASYARYLILKDVADLDLPVFQMSKETEKAARRALKEKNKAIKVTNVSKFLKEL